MRTKEDFPFGNIPEAPKVPCNREMPQKRNEYGWYGKRPTAILLRGGQCRVTTVKTGPQAWEPPC